MTTLVLGGNGFLGSHLVRQLCDRADRVRVLTRATSDLRPLAGLSYEHVVGNIFDAPSIESAMR